MHQEAGTAVRAFVLALDPCLVVSMLASAVDASTSSSSSFSSSSSRMSLAFELVRILWYSSSVRLGEESVLAQHAPEDNAPDEEVPATATTMRMSKRIRQEQTRLTRG